MTADHPTREERYAAVLADVDAAFSGDDFEENARAAAGEGEWTWFKWLARETVAAALVAADPAPAQADAALSDGELDHATCWCGLRVLDHDHPDATATPGRCRLTAAAALSQWLAARAAQPVPAPEADEWCRREDCSHRNWRSGSMPTHRRGENCPAPEVSRGVAEVCWRGECQRGCYYTDCCSLARVAHPADDGADCCRERTTAGGCGCGGE